VMLNMLDGMERLHQEQERTPPNWLAELRLRATTFAA
jgi:hypothetical protein